MTNNRDDNSPRLRREHHAAPSDADAAAAASKKNQFQCMGCGALQPRSGVVEVKEIARVVRGMLGSVGALGVQNYEHPIVCVADPKAKNPAPQPGCLAAVLKLPSKDPSWERVR